MTLDASAPVEERINDIIRILYEMHPDAHCELNHENALQLLIATILSAQCTDVRVNKVTPALFERYPTAVDYANADREELEEMVRSTGTYRNKARFVQESCQIIVNEHGGEVPADMKQLLAMPGVARKTANVVLGNCFDIAEGVVVDTHVKRLSTKLGMTTSTTPVKIEKDLMALVPQKEWVMIAHLLIFHGRRICKARKPACGACKMSHLCPSREDV